MEKNKKPRSLKDLMHENIVDHKLDGETIVEIELSQIKPNPYQPRRIFNEEKIQELAQSIKIHGVFQPIIVKETKDGYLIVSGERRFRASLSVGLKTIPAIIRPYDSNKLAEIALLENLQREDLTPIEEAEAYKAMMSRFNLTHLELSKQVGKSRSHITNLLGLLKLPDSVSNLILEQKLSMGHARALSKLNSEDKIIKLASEIIHKDLTVRQVESLLKHDSNVDKPKTNIQLKIEDTSIKNIEDAYQVKIKVTKKGLEILSNDQKKIDKVIETLIKQ